MPFKSEAQRRHLFAKEPAVAKEFAAHTSESQMEKLPEHVQKMESGGMMCRHCGGAVGEDGYAEDMGVEEGEAELSEADEGEETPQYKATMRSFADAVRGR